MTVSIGTLSYAAAAAAYCFLTVLLSFASMVTALWAGVMAYQAAHPESWKLPGELLEVGHKTAWFLFL